MIDFVEHQEDMIELTKVECSLIQITTSPQGTQTFDLPPVLKRQTGPEKARKDSYSALILGKLNIKVFGNLILSLPIIKIPMSAASNFSSK